MSCGFYQLKYLPCFFVIFIIFPGAYNQITTTMERDRIGRNKSKFYINGNELYIRVIELTVDI